MLPTSYETDARLHKSATCICNDDCDTCWLLSAGQSVIGHLPVLLSQRRSARMATDSSCSASVSPVCQALAHALNAHKG